MADKEYSPLSALCVRSLNDKLYEKRKQGALEIERLLFTVSSGNCGARTAHISPSVASLNSVTSGVILELHIYMFVSGIFLGKIWGLFFPR